MLRGANEDVAQALPNRLGWLRLQSMSINQKDAINPNLYDTFALFHSAGYTATNG